MPDDSTSAAAMTACASPSRLPCNNRAKAAASGAHARVHFSRVPRGARLRKRSRLWESSRQKECARRGAAGAASGGGRGNRLSGPWPKGGSAKLKIRSDQIASRPVGGRVARRQLCTEQHGDRSEEHTSELQSRLHLV